MDNLQELESKTICPLCLGPAATDDHHDPDETTLKWALIKRLLHCCESKQNTLRKLKSGYFWHSASTVMSLHISDIPAVLCPELCGLWSRPSEWRSWCPPKKKKNKQKKHRPVFDGTSSFSWVLWLLFLEPLVRLMVIYDNSWPAVVGTEG